jgi:hypothetical protein
MNGGCITNVANQNRIIFSSIYRQCLAKYTSVNIKTAYVNCAFEISVCTSGKHR